MTTVSYDHAQGAFFALGASFEDATRLSELRWTPHTGAANAWWTRSPYLAAPMWSRVDPADAPTRAALGPYAWNYETSFARAPLLGTGVDSIRIPMGQIPRPFQVAGVQRAVLRDRILIADEPGCGKTPQGLVLCNMVRPKRIVIGCPTVLVRNWARECELWLVDPQTITILDNNRKAVPDRGVIILPYSRGHTFHHKILTGPPIDVLIMDETQNLKTPGRRRTEPWIGDGGMAYHAKRVVAMTGTPILNNPLEVHQLLRCLSPETMGSVSRERFQAEYCSTFRGTAKVQTKSGGEASVQFETNEGKNEHALNAELRASGVMVRRMKNDVLDQLPPKHVYLVHLMPTAAIEELVREEATLYEMLETRLLTSQELMALQGHIMHVRARLGNLKAPKIAEFVETIFEAGETRVVLFMLHLEAIEIVRKAFEHTRIKVRVLTGAESPTVRDAHVQAFQRNDPGLELIVGQVTAAGVGLTMTAARYAVLGELAWAPAVNDQAIDRVHRQTQLRQVEAPVVTFPHAVEERVIRSGAKKAISARNILDTNLQSVIANS